MKDLPGQRIYGNIRQDRIRVVLSAVEQHLRNQSTLYEAVQLPSGLEIEHVMPQGWRTHWEGDPKLDPESAAARDRRVNTLGNLTLVTKSLNGSLSNRPWTDREAAGLKEGGAPDKGKWTLLNAFSLLVLNKEILNEHPERWTDEDIVERSERLTAAICEVLARTDRRGPGGGRGGDCSTVGGRAGRGAMTDSEVQLLAGEEVPRLVRQQPLTYRHTSTAGPGSFPSTSARAGALSE